MGKLISFDLYHALYRENHNFLKVDIRNFHLNANVLEPSGKIMPTPKSRLLEILLQTSLSNAHLTERSFKHAFIRPLSTPTPRKITDDL